MRIVLQFTAAALLMRESAVLDGGERQIIFLFGTSFYIPLGQACDQSR